MNIPENDIYDYLKNSDKPIIIYGMGNGADKILAQFECCGIKVNGIAASDNFVRGQSFHNFVVRKISDFESEYEDFIIITAFGTALPEVMDNIFSLAERHTVLAADVPVYGDNIWTKEFYRENIEDIERAYDLLADEKSRYVYDNIIKYKLSGRLDYLRSCYSGKDEVFSDILRLGKEESYLDLGAYRGDTIDEFLYYTGGSYSYITALEPDRKTFAKLKAHISGMKNVRIFRMGIWSEDRDMSFEQSLGRGSNIGQSGQNDLAVTKIDTLYAARRVSYIKMDVEGSERQSIIGGINTIKRDKPKLNIAAYHRSEDIFSIPLLINSIEPCYKLYMRQHPYIPAWDLNIYAVYAK